MNSVPKSSIYTRTGDQGETSLYNGDRKPKDDAVFQVLGDLDELNSAVGLVLAFMSLDDGWRNLKMCAELTRVQQWLLDLGSSVATPPESAERKRARVQLEDGMDTVIEEWIDWLSFKLPPLKNFILPGGSMTAAQLHVCRAVCRRAERSVTPLVREGRVEPLVQRVLNRLSDYFFQAARFQYQRLGPLEVTYCKPKTSK